MSVQILYASTYTGAAITVAMLGEIEVGRVMQDGPRAAWTCHLPPKWAWNWQRANSVDGAKAALEAAVARWLEQAGLELKGQQQ